MKKQLLFIFGFLVSVTSLKSQCVADFTYTVSAAGTLSVTGVGTPTGTAGYAWQWGDGTTIPGSGVTTSHTYTTGGTYSLCLTYGVLSLPPCTTQVCKNVVVTFVGVNEYFSYLKNITLSPNPAKSFINIDYSLTKPSKLSISLVDITGKLIDLVEPEKSVELGNYSKRYSIERLSSGLYFIRFKTENGVETKKLVVD